MSCTACACTTANTDSNSDVCNKVDGQCPCLAGYDGRICDACADTYYDSDSGAPLSCTACACTTENTDSNSDVCNKEDGQCPCLVGYDGRICDICADTYYDSDSGAPLSCTACACTTANTDGASDVCNKEDGQCTCKTGYTGRICDACEDGYYDSDSGNDLVCTACTCATENTEGGSNVCNKETGQCTCKTGYTGQNCDSCADEYYDSDTSATLTCTACGCTTANTESNSNVCDKTSGQCTCTSDYSGRTCDTANCAAGECCACSSTGTASCDDATGTCTCNTGYTGEIFFIKDILNWLLILTYSY